jgi:hypothetical protein
MKLKNIVPWGRAFEEYAAMFALSKNDLRKRILGCADGPAGFNARMTALGHHVVSCDPLYAFSRAGIARRIAQAADAVMPQVYRHKADYVWKNIPSPEDLLATRMAAMRKFLDDYDAGKKEGRYLAAGITALPFKNGTFDLALCSHFLFLYDDPGLAFHLTAIREMLRVAREVRIFPLNDMHHNKPSPFLAPIMQALRQDRYRARKVNVPYEFQKGARAMLRIIRLKEGPC